MNVSSFDLNANALFGVVVGFVSLFLALRYLLAESVLNIPLGNTKHGWKPISILGQKTFYCSVCQALLPTSTGFFCENCLLYIHSAKNCVKAADKLFNCKEKLIRNATTIRHLWVKGNLPLSTSCKVCRNEIHSEHTASGYLDGWRCAWCHRYCHISCLKNLKEDVCDFGDLKEFIIPPYSISAARKNGSFHLHLKGIKPPNIENWQPLFVIANSKSGGCMASEVVSTMRGYLHPLQVMDIGPNGPSDALQWVIKLSPIKCRLLIAGGDGTIAWVLTTITSLNIKPKPAVAIFPLGTGNDLSRVLGWGAASSVPEPLQILEKIKTARPVCLDSFELRIEKFHRVPIQRNFTKIIHMYNYFSIGVDALVTYNFHSTRQSKFYVFSSGLINKMVYFCFGSQQIVQRDCEGLEKKLDLYLDNCLVKLPELQSIIFLNIDSWGAGCKLCELHNTNAEVKVLHSISDGILEIFGLVSSFHMAQLQCGFSTPIRIGQAKQVKLHIKSTLPMQADGEPWLQQAPANIYIESQNQMEMLSAQQI